MRNVDPGADRVGTGALVSRGKGNRADTATQGSMGISLTGLSFVYQKGALEPGAMRARVSFRNESIAELARSQV